MNEPMRLTRYNKVDVVCDKERSFGRPIVDRLGIPVSAIIERFVAGESPNEICDDFDDVTPNELFDILRVELDDPAYRRHCETAYEIWVLGGLGGSNE